MDLKEKFIKIRALIFDIDGVMTDGTFGYSSVDEIKFFNTQDGIAILYARNFGYIVGAISGRACAANKRRAEELHFDFLYEEIGTKMEIFERILKDFNLTADECLYMGDDLQDIAVIKRAGIGVMPANAPKYLYCWADFITISKGGHGAVREIIDHLFDETGQKEKLYSLYGIE